MWSRRDPEETYNEQLLREAGLLAKPTLTPMGVVPSDPAWRAAFGYGARPSVLDVTTAVEAPAVAGDTVVFATLPDGDIIVESETGDADLAPFADAVEKQLPPPYRALARRQTGSLWAVGARKIEVRRLQRDGEEFEEVERGALVRGTRLDGDDWEIEVVGRL